MKRYLLGTAFAVATPMAAAAQDCGEVSIAEMNWASAQIVTAVTEFLLVQGYSCDVTVVPSDTTPAVTSLCENNDKFAVDRQLPEIEVGDIVVIHDAGAHGHAMGFNYNGKLRSAEVLLRPDGSVEMIRRPETVDDLFATLHFPGL